MARLSFSESAACKTELSSDFSCAFHSFKGWRKSENEKLYEERKKRCDYMTFKGHAINYNVRGTSNGMLKVRKGGGHDG